MANNNKKQKDLRFQKESEALKKNLEKRKKQQQELNQKKDNKNG